MHLKSLFLTLSSLALYASASTHQHTLYITPIKQSTSQPLTLATFEITSSDPSTDSTSSSSSPPSSKIAKALSWDTTVASTLAKEDLYKLNIGKGADESSSIVVAGSRLSPPATAPDAVHMKTGLKLYIDEKDSIFGLSLYEASSTPSVVPSSKSTSKTKSKDQTPLSTSAEDTTELNPYFEIKLETTSATTGPKPILNKPVVVKTRTTEAGKAEEVEEVAVDERTFIQK